GISTPGYEQVSCLASRRASSSPAQPCRRYSGIATASRLVAFARHRSMFRSTCSPPCPALTPRSFVSSWVRRSRCRTLDSPSSTRAATLMCSSTMPRPTKSSSPDSSSSLTAARCSRLLSPLVSSRSAAALLGGRDDDDPCVACVHSAISPYWSAALWREFREAGAQSRAVGRNKGHAGILVVPVNHHVPGAGLGVRDRHRLVVAQQERP